VNLILRVILSEHRLFPTDILYIVELYTDGILGRAMRLRVTVRRHGLPDTSIIWVVDSSAAPTVFQLLEHIIPIESDGEWGLDDYAVELKGPSGSNYECLHFQPVASVMKEEDEVLYVMFLALPSGVSAPCHSS